MDVEIGAIELVFRLFVAMALGAIIGYEREARGHSAGLRTHIMVTLGSAAFSIVAMKLYEMHPTANNNLGIDPSRVIQGIIGGIGFLGAGAIIHGRGQIEGLTTAAGIWVASGVGIAAGVGLYWLAIVTSALALVTLAGMRILKDQMIPENDDDERNDDLL